MVMQVQEPITNDLALAPVNTLDFSRIYTLEQFLNLDLPDDNNVYELIKGKIVARKKTGVSAEHGRVIGRSMQHLNNYLDQNPVGEAYAQSSCTLGQTDPEASYVEPDVCLVLYDKFKKADDGSLTPSRSMIDTAPDIVAEVISPSDSEKLVLEKVENYLAAGVRLVWWVHYLYQYIIVHEANGERRGLLDRQDDLSAKDVLPGFSLNIGKFFASRQPK
jgi:Uma2 family endonuclease